jgi:hypothetical protein
MNLEAVTSRDITYATPTALSCARRARRGRVVLGAGLVMHGLAHAMPGAL